MSIEFSDDKVEVDKTTYNPSRICILYGTIACKGDNIPTRPHRQARIISIRGEGEIVTISQITKIVSKLQDKHNINTEVTTICNTTHTKIALQSTLKQCLMDLDEGESVSCYENQFPLKTSNFQNWFP